MGAGEGEERVGRGGRARERGEKGGKGLGWGGCDLGALYFPLNTLAYNKSRDKSSFNSMMPTRSKTQERQLEQLDQLDAPCPLKLPTETPETMQIHDHWQQLALSTPPASLILEDIRPQPIYRLSPCLLEGSPLSESMRARMRNFLMQECERQLYLRETCVLACTYMDLYLLRGGRISVAEFQLLAIGCLILASKLRENKLPLVSQHLYKREELFAWEARIMKTLNYRINPPTYVDYAERAVLLWDQFAAAENGQLPRFTQTDVGVNVRLREFYEQLDLICLTLKSLQYDVEQLTLNLLYLRLRALATPHPRTTHAQSNIPSPSSELYSHDEFQHLFQRYLQHYTARSIQLDQQIGDFLQHFLIWNTPNTHWRITQTSPCLERIRNLDRLQTHPRGCLKTYKEIMAQLQQGSPSSPKSTKNTVEEGLKRGSPSADQVLPNSRPRRYAKQL